MQCEPLAPLPDRLVNRCVMCRHISMRGRCQNIHSDHYARHVLDKSGCLRWSDFRAEARPKRRKIAP